MSAFLVSRHDIDILVTAYVALRPWEKNDPTTLGRQLWAENVKSVKYRYSHWTTPEFEAAWPDLKSIVVYRHEPIFAKAAAVAKIARCYDYQSCEHPTYERSIAEIVVSSLMRAFPESLPGYDAAPWGISSERDLEAVRV